MLTTAIAISAISASRATKTVRPIKSVNAVASNDLTMAKKDLSAIHPQGGCGPGVVAPVGAEKTHPLKFCRLDGSDETDAPTVGRLEGRLGLDGPTKAILGAVAPGDMGGHVEVVLARRQVLAPRHKDPVPLRVRRDGEALPQGP